jgi:hypothetical protein
LYTALEKKLNPRMTQDEMWQNKERDSTCTEDQKSVPQLTSGTDEEPDGFLGRFFSRQEILEMISA